MPQMGEKIAAIQPKPAVGPNVYQRILSIMEELDYIQKGDKQGGGLQYRFVSHDQVTSAIHPLLVKHRILIIPNSEEIKQDGNRTSIKIGLAFVNVDNPTDSFVTYWYGYGVDGSDKGVGKAVSYAYKYAILKTFALETGDDPDQDQNSVYEPVKCLEFDLLLPAELSEKDRQKLNKFLSYSAVTLKKHVEDVKREAVSRMDDFLKAFKNWNPKKGE